MFSWFTSYFEWKLSGALQFIALLFLTLLVTCTIIETQHAHLIGLVPMTIIVTAMVVLMLLHPLFTTFSALAWSATLLFTLLSKNPDAMVIWIMIGVVLYGFIRFCYTSPADQLAIIGPAISPDPVH